MAATNQEWHRAINKVTASTKLEFDGVGTFDNLGAGIKVEAEVDRANNESIKLEVEDWGAKAFPVRGRTGGTMDQKERQETQHGDLYVVPVVGGAIVGYIIADWLGVSGLLGIGISAFVVDAFRGLRGTHRFVREAEHLVQQARMVWERQKCQRPTREDAPDIENPSQTPPDEEPADGAIYPSA